METNNKFISAKKLREMQFKRLGISGKFLEYIGNIAVGSKPIFIMGEPTSGKSTFALQLFDHLTYDCKLKGLIVEAEEGVSSTLQKRVFDRMTPQNNNFQVCSSLDVRTFIDSEKAKKPRHRFKVLVINSYQLANITYRDCWQLSEELPQLLVIGISQMNPDGSPYGGNQIKHLADIKLFFAKGFMEVHSRYLDEVKKVKLFDYVPEMPNQTKDVPQTKLF